MNTRVTWIKGNTLGSPILQIENNIHPFTEELWFANDKIDDEEKYLEVVSMTDDRKEGNNRVGRDTRKL
jgi:hypothetical protein